MAKKRKTSDAQIDIKLKSRPKRQKTRSNLRDANDGQHPVLRLHYERVTTLREYISARFPNSSLSRKQRLKAVPAWSDLLCQRSDVGGTTLSTLAKVSIGRHSATIEYPQSELSKLLDTTIVGYQGGRTFEARRPEASTPYRQNIQQLSQKLRTTLKSTSSQLGVSQSDIVDFAVGHLFNSVHRGPRLPPHVICNGFLRSPPSQGISDLWSNGLYCTFPNCNAAILSSGAWPALLKSLGKDGDQVILDLIFNCGIFVPLESGRNNLCQISGIQLSELPLLNSPALEKGKPSKRVHIPAVAKAGQAINRSSEIKIIRNRMFYARPGLNSKGMVRLGLQHIHVFNRYSDAKNPQHIIHLLMYIFPRQFGLHNVFTSKPDRRETIQAQKDYTMREKEIELHLRKRPGKIEAHGSSIKRIPKRLRGFVCLISKILKRHSRICRGTDIVDLATPPEHVFAFCQSVLLRLLPPGTFDAVGGQPSNLYRLFRYVAEFISHRKRETLDLHSIVQGFKWASEIPWLVPPTVIPGAKLAMSDHLKRKELLEELLYYIFDSILIPLIRSNFHVTESNNHTHRLFYFRHDVWRRLTEPCLNELRQSMFEVQAYDKKSETNLYSMPYGHMRLVPKGSSFRPIMNLKRKPMIYQNGAWILGPRSVNMMLKPVYSMLKHERLQQPGLLGSSMFSVDEIYPKIKPFLALLKNRDCSNEKLYFAKVDVTNCFDTIPQDAVLELMEDVCSQAGYCPSRHAEVSIRRQQGVTDVPLTKRFRDREPARGVQDRRAFPNYISAQYSERRSNTVFVEQSVPSLVDREKLMKLLKDHIIGNKVRVGKKFLNQKRGIPQGSILSSILCNFFYGQFEAEYLDFLDTSDSLLLRLLDDFLLITLDKEKASRFVRVMHQGSPKYGITIKPQKSMINFAFTVDGHAISRCTGATFPYCGKRINTTSLEISRDRERQVVSRINESLSIERSNSSGEAFYRLTLDAMKRQLHAQYTDTTLNSDGTILQTLYQDFLWSALRMHAYIKGLGPSRRPIGSLMIRTIGDLGNMTFSILTSPSKLKDDMKYECRITSSEVQWLMAKAFKQALGAKQNLYNSVLMWLDTQLEASKPKNVKGLRKLQTAVSSASAAVDWCKG